MGQAIFDKNLDGPTIAGYHWGLERLNQSGPGRVLRLTLVVDRTRLGYERTDNSKCRHLHSTTNFFVH